MRHDEHRSSYALSLRVAGLAVLATAAVVFLPFVHFAYRAPAVHVVLETLNAVVALLVAYLVYGRYRHDGRRQELLLVLGLGTVAVANLVLTALPTALSSAENGNLDRWAPVGVRLAGTILLAAASLTPQSLVDAPGSAKRPVALVCVIVLSLAALGLVLGPHLPSPIDPSFDIADSSRPAFAGHPAVLVLQAVSALLLDVASVAFTRQAVRTGDELLRWVGAGCVLGAASRVHFLLYPSLYSDVVYTGDVLRLGFFLLMLVGATREIRSFWETRAHAAVLDDRRRLARDLHDGLAQELTFIYSQTKRLLAHPGDVVVAERVNDAAARAIDEARTAITALAVSDRACFSDVLRQSTERLASRYEVKADVDVQDDVVLEPALAEAVLRIVGEAFRNAVRHGHARRVAVRLSVDPVQLVVTDDGQGFDPSTSKSSSGFGLTSMRQRAEGQGASFELVSSPGGGTTVRVAWR